jgi:hypothetical protein
MADEMHAGLTGGASHRELAPPPADALPNLGGSVGRRRVGRTCPAQVTP